MLGGDLAERIGASPMLYAALAYFVFDESFFLEDLSENYPEQEQDLIWWLESFFADHYRTIEQLRMYYASPLQEHSGTGRARFAPYRLLHVVYDPVEECLAIRASSDESDHHLGSEWRLPTGRGRGDDSDWDELRRTFRISGRSGLCVQER